MSADVGKREAHKIATRRAIQSAADALFEHRGYAQTTVRDIADAAGVTERTFFRYFSGKEALLVKDIEAGIPVLADEIRRRPATESPLEAVENALLVTADRLRETQPNLSWLFQDGPPGPNLAKSSPGLLFQLEQAVAEALADRMESSRPLTDDAEFEAQVLARCAVAALRSTGIRRWQLERRGDTGVSETRLLAQAFAIVRRGGPADRRPRR